MNHTLGYKPKPVTPTAKNKVAIVAVNHEAIVNLLKSYELPITINNYCTILGSVTELKKEAEIKRLNSGAPKL